MKKQYWIVGLVAVLFLLGCQSVSKKQAAYAPESVNHLVFVGKLKHEAGLQKNAISYWQATLNDGYAAFYSPYDVALRHAYNTGDYRYHRISGAVAELDYAPKTGVTNPPLYGQFTFYFNKPNQGRFIAKIYKYKDGQPNVHPKPSDLIFVKDQQGTFQLVKHA